MTADPVKSQVREEKLRYGVSGWLLPRRRVIVPRDLMLFLFAGLLSSFYPVPGSMHRTLPGWESPRF